MEIAQHILRLPHPVVAPGAGSSQSKNKLFGWTHENRYPRAVLMRSYLCSMTAAAAAAAVVALMSAANSLKAGAPATVAASTNRPTFWLIPHTHWEGAVFKT